MGDRANVSMRVGRGRHDSRCLRPDDGSGQVVRLERTCAAPSRECAIQVSSENHGRPDAELIDSCRTGVNLGGRSAGAGEAKQRYVRKMFVRVSNSWSMLPTCGNFEEKASDLRIRSRVASRLGA
jgi:hypothetical protein